MSPDRGGAPLLETVDKCTSHGDAVSAAASKIYVHIAKGATGAFPIWVRWRSEKALQAYQKGCRQQTQGRLIEAAISLNDAVDLSPFNALARLQLANLYEQRKASANDDAERVSLQAEALRRYLEIARHWPGLVEARYRVSVTAAALGAALDQSHRAAEDARLAAEIDPTALAGAESARSKDESYRGDVVARLRLTGTNTTNIAVLLRQLASVESAAVLQLLRPWYALLHDGRLRNQFEPKAHERRGLKHVVRISKHCVRLRAWSTKAGPWTRVRVQYRVFVVHFGHMFLGRGNLTWQAEYNAACFDALLLARPEPTPRPPFASLLTLGELWRGYVDRGRSERALRNLDHAIRNAGSELSPVWVAEADPDLSFFRSPPTDPRFFEIVGRMPQDPIEHVTAADAQVPNVRPGLEPISPAVRPWGSPVRRLLFWLAVGLVYALAVVASGLGEHWPFLIALILPVWRVWTAWRETRLIWEDDAADPPAEAA